MVIIFATKRNPNGHRKWLVIDFEAKNFAIAITDFVEVSATDMKRIENELKENGFTQE